MDQTSLGFDLSRLAFMGYLPKDAEPLVDAFMEQGGSFFLADALSLRLVRELLSRRYDRSRFQVALLLSHRADLPALLAEAELFAADIGLLALPEREAEWVSALNRLSEQRQLGLLSHIGLDWQSEPEALEALLAAHPEPECLRLPLNFLDWEHPVLQVRRCCEAARKQGKWLIAAQPLKGGVLAWLPPEAEAAFRQHSPGRSISAWGLRFAAAQEGVRVVCCGMTDREQIWDDLETLSRPVTLSDEDRRLYRQANAMIGGYIAISCIGCGRCAQVCPQQLPIPSLFSLFNTELLDTGPRPRRVQRSAYARLARRYGKAGDCVACHHCEAVCPRQIPISRHMLEVAECMEAPDFMAFDPGNAR